MMSSNSLQNALSHMQNSTKEKSFLGKKNIPATPPTTPNALRNDLNTAHGSMSVHKKHAVPLQTGIFEASFTGLDLSEFGESSTGNFLKNEFLNGVDISNRNTSSPSSASHQYLQWKQKQKEIRVIEDIEEKRMNTHVNFILANKSLEKILIGDTEMNLKKQKVEQNHENKTISIPEIQLHDKKLKGGVGLQDLSATLTLMHGTDDYGANRENHGKRSNEHNYVKTQRQILQSKQNGRSVKKQRWNRNKAKNNGAAKRKFRKAKF